MKSLILTTLLILVQLESSKTTAVYSQPLKFQIEATKFESNREWTKITISASGGVKPYEYFFDQYPKGWKYLNQELFVGKQFLSFNRKYPCKVRVQDKNGNQAKATIVVLVRNQYVAISETIYPYDQKFSDNFFNYGIFMGRPEMAKGGYYDSNENTNLTAYSGFVPFEQLKIDKQMMNQINSGAVTDSYGTGLDALSNFQFGSNNLGPINIGPLPFDINAFQFDQNTYPFNQNNVISTQPLLPTASNNNNNAIVIPFSWDNVNNFLQANPLNNLNLNNIIPSIGIFLDSLSTTQPNNQSITQPSNRPISQPSNRSISQPNYQSITQPNYNKVVNTSGNSQPKLPTSRQIDDLILSADAVSISKIIQTVNITSSYSCQQKTIYLNNLLARLQSAISMKKYAAEELRSLSKSALSESSSLTIQIVDKKKQISALSITSLKEKLSVDLQTLQQLYSQFNNADSQVAPIDIEIEQLKKDISIQKVKSESDRQQLVKQKLAFTQADDYIKKIERSLNQARSRKITIQETIKKSEGSIEQSSSKVKINQQSLTKLESELKVLQSTSDQLKLAYQILQITVSRFRSEISRGARSQDQYLAEISLLEQKLSIEKKKIVSDQLAKLKQMVTTLQGSLPSIENIINSNYYTCYKPVNMTSQTVGLTTVYIIPVRHIQNYLETSYSLKVDPKFLNIISNEIRLSPINILDSAWQTSIGQPYDIVQYAGSKDFSFSEDFNCLNPSILTSGVGIIRKIESRNIIIDNMNSGTYILNLGTCSRIETSQLLPTVGQKVFWRGVPGALKNQFNIYRASCI